MWLVKEKGRRGPVFGHADQFDGLGVFIDTYKNNRPGVVFPYVMAMVGDGKTTYNKDNDGKETELAGCSARGLRNSNVATKLRLTYFQDKQLKLEMQYKTEDEFIVCFDIENPPAIPSVTYLGFSAETGELSDNHDIISIEAKNMYVSGGNRANANTQNSKKPFNNKPASGGSWLGFFFKIILVILVLGGGYAGWTAYRSSKRRTHRF